MSQTPRERKDRRQLNVSVGQECRGSAPERRKCPECGAALSKAVRRLSGGSVTVMECGKCGWTRASRQTDADVLMLKMTWALRLEAKGGGLSASLPPELSEALQAKPGDELVISPLTSPLGSLPMKWALSLQRKKASKK
jgi:Zn ribbon nucleic-acid-binding protein